IVYVGCAAVLNMLTHDPQTSYVWLSILASGVAVVLMFYFGARLFDRSTGLLAALFLLISPLFWFYGEVALPHVIDVAMVLGVVLLLYQTLTVRASYLPLAAIVLGLAGGFRPQTVI